MIKAKCYTTPETKIENWPKFAAMIQDQLEYGKKKYASGDEREATDIIAECFGLEWQLGTMQKYLLRFKNLQRSRDLFKIATYCFLVWMQMGYHLEDEQDTDTWNEKENT